MRMNPCMYMCIHSKIGDVLVQKNKKIISGKDFFGLLGNVCLSEYQICPYKPSLLNGIKVRRVLTSK
jgi:hypothetical protein